MRTLHSGCLLDSLFNPENVGSTFLRNVSKLLSDYKTLYPSLKISNATDRQLFCDTTPLPFCFCKGQRYSSLIKLWSFLQTHTYIIFSLSPFSFVLFHIALAFTRRIPLHTEFSTKSIVTLIPLFSISSFRSSPQKCTNYLFAGTSRNILIKTNSPQHKSCFVICRAR
jgi:hypothetical protein